MNKRLVKSLYSARWESLRRLLREARCDAGLTQVELAARLKRPQSLVAKIEAGERKLDVCQLLDYLEVIGADPLPIIRALVDSSARGKPAQSSARKGKS